MRYHISDGLTLLEVQVLIARAVEVQLLGVGLLETEVAAQVQVTVTVYESGITRTSRKCWRGSVEEERTSQKK
jgi:hypothetical protein